MKSFFILVILLLGNLCSNAERRNTPVDSVNQGIRFEENLSWKETLAKAKAEHKYIFVDCYTTWCGPCKQMDRDVYSDPKVGEFFNTNFICYRAQMDTSKSDNELIRKRYADSKWLDQTYHITAYPSYLFFTPDGNLLNRSMGAQPVETFIALGRTTIDPEHSYYSLLEKFLQGKATTEQTSFLAKQAIVLGDTAQSHKIGKTYIEQLNKDSLYTKANIQFMSEFTTRSSDQGFAFFYQHADTINNIMHDDNFAQDAVYRVVKTEMVLPDLKKAQQTGTNPDWAQLETAITKKYNAYYADRIITGTRFTWAEDHKNWPEFTKYMVKYMDNYGPKVDTGGYMASLYLNHWAWGVFTYSNNKDELKRALSWSGRSMLIWPDASWMDTYANILYKLGNIKPAIEWEQTALALAPKSKELAETLDKMRKGIPTWPSPDQL